MHPLATLNVSQGQVAIHWFEQSSYAVKESGGAVLQIDPYFPHSRPEEKFIHAQPPLDESQLPTDYVLLTHSHGDHTCSESITRIWNAFPHARFIGPRESIEKILAETPVSADHTQVIEAGESARLGDMTVHAVFAKPPAGDPAANIAPPDVTHLGYVIDADGVILYFSGDPINNFAEHDELIQAVAAFHPQIGFLTNHPTEGEFPFYEGSVKMAQRIGLQHAVPAHRACFVKRDYDPQEWAAQFPADGPEPLIIPRNSHIIYP
jgi:L-ascorbate metabolism protein UlaG (beta-lactamase superfamily)